MTKTDLNARLIESRGRWKPGREASDNPIPSELEHPKAFAGRGFRAGCVSA